nr:metal ABC transporter permease [Angustibacter aerolatus]
MQRALLAALLVGLAAPVVGIFLVQRRLALIGDGMGHVALAGVAAGVLTRTAPVWTALALSVLAAVAIEPGARPRTDQRGRRAGRHVLWRHRARRGAHLEGPRGRHGQPRRLPLRRHHDHLAAGRRRLRGAGGGRARGGRGAHAATVRGGERPRVRPGGRSAGAAAEPRARRADGGHRGGVDARRRAAAHQRAHGAAERRRPAGLPQPSGRAWPRPSS